MKGSNLPKVSLKIYWRNSVGSTDIQGKFSAVYVAVVPGLIKMCVD
jgi:hypothetical protein